MIRDAATNQNGSVLNTGKASPRLRGLRDAGEIVSASIVNCTDENDNPIPCPGFASTGPTTQPGSTAPSSFSLFSSPNAYASGTGLGPLNLPNPFSASTQSTIASAFLIVAAVIAFLLLVDRK
jgi:hypothetical protein